MGPSFATIASMSVGPLVTPWPVAEAIALRLARHKVGSVRIDAAASRSRMLRVLPEAALASGMRIELARPDAKADATISIEDVLDPAGLCRQRLLLRAESARVTAVGQIAQETSPSTPAR